MPALWWVSGFRPRSSTKKGTAVTKNYQTSAPMTSAELRLALPEAVSVAMGEIAEDVQEGCWRWPSAPGCR